MVRFARVKIGDPPQELEFDLDMLHPDFFLISTTSIEHFGSQYNSFASRSHGKPKCRLLKIRLTFQAGSETRVHTDCRLPTDLLHLSNTTVSTSLSIQIPMCGRPKYSRRTLGSSGNVLGLAPSNHLAQITHPSLLGLLNGSVPESLWSMTLLDAHSGILSCGTTIALDVEEAKIRTQIELENMDKQGVDATFIEKETQLHLSNFQQQEWRDLFRWSDVRGAAGWWTTLLQGVWVNGAKILKNQPVLFDIQVPFILAPPLAVKRFYASISGSKRIQKPFDRFFAFPCLNQPSIAFEFNAWLYPTMGGEKSESDDYTGLHGGKFSLGKEMPGSGYCVGLVVETSMGLIQDMYSNDGQFGKRKVIVRNDLRDFWVLGEPFFRGMGLVLDVEKQKIGFRSY